MKKLILFLTTLIISIGLLQSQSNLVSGVLLPYKFTEGLKYTSLDIKSKQYTTNNLSIYKTYSVSNNTFDVTTKTNQNITLYLANNNIVKVEPNSEFRVDSFDLFVKESPQYPIKITQSQVNLNLALMDGEALFVINKVSPDDQILLQTPVVNLGLESGKYFVQISKKSVLIYILTGSLNVFDNITNKKELVTAGNAVLIHPAPMLSPKQQEMFGDKMTTTVKKAKVEQFKPYVEEVTKLEFMLNEFIFIIDKNQVTGVKVK